jgi:hypothetical protein
MQMSKAIEFFYKNVMESSSDEEFDSETELLFTTASMEHDHYMLPKHMGGSSVKRKAKKDRDRVGGHACLMRDYIPTNVISITDGQIFLFGCGLGLR